MKAYLAVTKALSDPNRVRILCALQDGELCVCQLTSLLQLAASTVSKHCSILHQANLVDSRKDGRWVYYRLPRTSPTSFGSQVTRQTFAALADSEQITADRECLADIRETDLNELCSRLLRS